MRSGRTDTLGVDIGGVIVRLTDYSEDDGPRGELRHREMPGARAALQRLRDERFGDAVYLVSKCGAQTEATIKRSLVDTGFCDDTGLGLDHVFFCRQRHEKAPICELIGVTHFVDDRLEVLSHLGSVPHRYLFDGRPDEIRPYAHVLPAVTPVGDWASLVDLLLGPLSST